MNEIKLSDQYIKLLKRMRIIYSLTLKRHAEYISIHIDNTECKSFNIGSLPVNLKPVVNVMNNITDEAVKHINETQNIKVNSQYIEMANRRIWDLQHTVRYKKIITDVFQYSLMGDAEKVCNSLQEFRSYVYDMIEPEWL